MIPFGEYCSYDKAVQHLGDRWSLLIIRELAVHETLGFNALAACPASPARCWLGAYAG